MRILHWTPRYAVRRVAWGWYEWRNPETPWLTPRSIEILSVALPTDVGVE
jgi:hypothetical protein